jgi:hypothetical protein
VAQAQENARGGDIKIEAGDLQAMRKAVEALGEPS